MKKRNSALLILAVAAVLLILTVTGGSDFISRQNPPASDESKVIFFAVGDADSILIMDGSGQNMLIDTGDNAHEEALAASLRSLGIEKIDILVLTHPHEDHIGGADLIIRSFEIGTVYMTEVSKDSASFTDLLEAADEKGLLFTSAHSGVTFELGTSRFEMLNPDEGSEYSDMNDYSVVLYGQIGGADFYFMGDATEKIEKQLLDRTILSECDVLKVGHHGSAGSSSQDFLEVIQPTYAVVSCDSDGPSTAAENRLRSSGAKIYVTGTDGSVVMTVSSGHITVVTENE